ncbi:MAG: AraC family ligand binding domain-containing protein, partial [Clostridia bacterium]|nr:AraC family ligand binding domain-containing protein [Clostridia bacterium]
MKPKDGFLQAIRFKSEDFKIIVSSAMSTASRDAFHPEIEIKLFNEGDSIQTIGSKTIIAHAGDITIANPYEVHANIATDSHKGKYYLIMIDLDFFKNTGLIDVDLRNLLVAEGVAFNNHIKNNNRLNQILMRVIEEATEQKEYYQSIIRNLMAEFFSLLLRDELFGGDPRLLTTKEIKKATLI